MDAVKFIKEYGRMCGAHEDCISCPLNNVDDMFKPCAVDIAKNPSRAIEIVGQWSKEHPVKTYLSVLLEKFPNAILEEEN